MTPEDTDTDDLTDGGRETFRRTNGLTCVRPDEGHIESGTDFDVGLVQLVVSNPDPDLGSFDLAVVLTDSAGRTDKVGEDGGGDHR